jgi:hypothetical protein
MWRSCDLFEFATPIRAEALNSASMEGAQTNIRAALPANDVDRALICIFDSGRVAIHVAFERDSRHEPPHAMRRKWAMEILMAVSMGVMDIIEGDLTGSASRWIGTPGHLYKASEMQLPPAGLRRQAGSAPLCLLGSGA